MPSFRQAVNDKCKQCAYDPADRGTWRKQVENCGVPDCPLYPLRPTPTNARKDEICAQTDAIPSLTETTPSHPTGSPPQRAQSAIEGRS